MGVQDFGIRIQHAGIHVRSIEKTAEWYHEVFGFELDPGQRGGSMAGMFPKMRWMSLGDFKLEVYEVPDAGDFSSVDLEYTVGVKHLNFGVRDIEGWLAYVKERGDIEILVDNDYGHGNRAVYIKDIDGILVEVTNDPEIRA